MTATADAHPRPLPPQLAGLWEFRGRDAPWEIISSRELRTRLNELARDGTRGPVTFGRPGVQSRMTVREVIALARASGLLPPDPRRTPQDAAESSDLPRAS